MQDYANSLLKSEDLLTPRELLDFYQKPFNMTFESGLLICISNLIVVHFCFSYFFKKKSWHGQLPASYFPITRTDMKHNTRAIRIYTEKSSLLTHFYIWERACHCKLKPFPSYTLEITQTSWVRAIHYLYIYRLVLFRLVAKCCFPLFFLYYRHSINKRNLLISSLSVIRQHWWTFFFYSSLLCKMILRVASPRLFVAFLDCSDNQN